MTVAKSPKNRLRLVDYKIPVVHRKPAADLIVSPTLQTWSPGEDMRIIRIGNDALEDFKELVKTLQQYRAKRLKGETSASNTLTVADIFNLVSDAYKQYEQGENGFKGKAKQNFRSISARAPILRHWIPLAQSGGDYGTPVTGPLQIVASAAQRSYDIRRSVKDAVSDIPFIWRRNIEYISLYNPSLTDSLAVRVVELFKAVIIALRLIFEYLSHGSTHRAWNAVVKGEHFKQALQESIEDVMRLERETAKEASICFQKKMLQLAAWERARQQTSQVTICYYCRNGTSKTRRVLRAMVGKGRKCLC